ncbi:MAG: HEAT repeat domain-containing protein [candidate division Zixibacteria bacterium]|nr:HEAT repeat domain-containing protein [candidate division Zixibacteria bacterium]
MAEEQEIAEISKTLTELLKVIKVVSVYPENNPLSTKLRESFSERFAILTEDNDSLVFSIGRNKIYYQGETVYEDLSNDEALAEIFYKAGLTELTFTSSFQYDECNQFFKIMKSFVNRDPGAEDLIALLWQEEIVGFRYATVEDVCLSEYDGEFSVRTGNDKDDSFITNRRIIGRGVGGDSDYEAVDGVEGESGKVQYSKIFLDDDELADASEKGVAYTGDEQLPEGVIESDIPMPAGMVNSGLSIPQQSIDEQKMGMTAIPSQKPTQLPDTVQILNEAFTLSETDMGIIEDMLKDDIAFDPFESTCRLIKELLWSQSEYGEFAEVVTVIEKTQSEFVRFGNLRAAATLFINMSDVEKELTKNRIRWKNRIHDAFIFAGGREALSDLAKTLNNNSELESDELVAYLNIFGWEALSSIVDLLGDLEFRNHREALCEYLVRMGKEHVDIVSRGVFDRRWFVVRNSVAVLARIGGEKAFNYLEKALGHEDPRVRLQIARGLKENHDQKSIGILKQLIWDSDEIVSQLAIQSVFNMPKEDKFKIITELINDDRFATLSEANQELFITTFSELGGEYAVSYLTTLISGWGFLQTQAQEFYQRIAFRALARNRSEKAEKALLKLSRTWRAGIRQKAKDALQERREMIYGDE